jgi:SAM-dependent methyltransferase
MGMEQITDWARLWRQLVESHRASRSGSAGPWRAETDPWKERAREFASRVHHKWARPDPVRDFMATRVEADTTVLDIGAGTGTWAVFLARHARKVTAVEPSPAMRAVLQEHLATEGIGNVEVVDGFWPDVSVEAHDLAFCSHAMYGSADLPAFVSRMVDVARRGCYLLLRVPMRAGVMAQAAERVWGQPHDSPNFVVAYNVLLQMGICADVVVDPNPWQPWASPSLEDALGEVKRRLGLSGGSEHDAYLRDLLARRLVLREGQYVWPVGVHSALAHWDVAG